MNKEDRLCEYIDLLINKIYTIQVSECKQSQDNYMELCNGLETIGFRLDPTCPTRFRELKV